MAAITFTPKVSNRTNEQVQQSIGSQGMAEYLESQKGIADATVQQFIDDRVRCIPDNFQQVARTIAYATMDMLRREAATYSPDPVGQELHTLPPINDCEGLISSAYPTWKTDWQISFSVSKTGLEAYVVTQGRRCFDQNQHVLVGFLDSASIQLRDYALQGRALGYMVLQIVEKAIETAPPS